MSIEFMFFAAGFVIGAFVSIFVCFICWYQKKMAKYRKPKKSTITPVFAKSEIKFDERKLKKNVVTTAIQRDRLMLEDSDQVFEYAAKKLLRQIASTIREQLMDNIEVSRDYKTNCMILKFTFWTRRGTHDRK